MRSFVLYIAMTFTCAQNYYHGTSTFHRYTVKHCKNKLKLLKHDGCKLQVSTFFAHQIRQRMACQRWKLLQWILQGNMMEPCSYLKCVLTLSPWIWGYWTWNVLERSLNLRVLDLESPWNALEFEGIGPGKSLKCPWIWGYWTWKVLERSLNLKLTKVWEPCLTFSWHAFSVNKIICIHSA